MEKEETEDGYSAKIEPSIDGYSVSIYDSSQRAGFQYVTGDYFYSRWRAVWYAKRTLRRLRRMGGTEVIR